MDFILHLVAGVEYAHGQRYFCLGFAVKFGSPTLWRLIQQALRSIREAALAIRQYPSAAAQRTVLR